MALVDDICLEISRGNCTLMILLVLLAAFDTVDYEVLIKHL